MKIKNKKSGTLSKKKGSQCFRLSTKNAVNGEAGTRTYMY